MTIRTPDDEKPIPWLYPPFAPGRIYHGATYPGHSDFATDWNRRNAAGAWLQDEGDPVLAAQDGKVAEVVKADGMVRLAHGDGWQTVYRHMTDIPVKEGDRVQRGDQIGRIGNVAGSGSSFGPHLHFQVLRNGTPVQTRFEGQAIRTSVAGSDGKPPTWDPPDPVPVTGPPPRATWEDAYRLAAKALERTEERLAAQRDQTTLALGERDAARTEARLATEAVGGLRTDLTAARARIVELENASPPDCAPVIRERDDALAALNVESAARDAAEGVIERIRAVLA